MANQSVTVPIGAGVGYTVLDLEVRLPANEAQILKNVAAGLAAANATLTSGKAVCSEADAVRYMIENLA